MKRGETEKNVVHLDFGQQQAAARSADGWLQGRYYSSDGLSVKEFLSFNSVFDICPFEVGVSRTRERREFRARLAKVSRLLELSEFMPRPFQSLSNGEMRRVLFARAILKAPDVLVLDDPMAGLDPSQRERFKKIISALSRDGIEIRIKCRHADEVPAAFASSGGYPAATRSGEGAASPKGAASRRARDGETPALHRQPENAARSASAPYRKLRRRKAAEQQSAPVVELRGITVRFGKRKLFDRFSWTVRRGERWVLRGRNGSGKTTLMALITGDSPLAYANDVRVFGVRRGEGALADTRGRIGIVSPEMQTYGDASPEEMLESALAGEPELLLLDEPCLNLGVVASRRILRRIAAWLARRPAATAICVAHRPDHIPPGFNLVQEL